ncbi:hypothetical protein [Streptomyces sp. CRN 30]|uniref:hypothetical protein n=1 Tax=Streptomyces sp. CRN 30 TaxID=3075613 RepID=UPI002A8096D6|nr:hypothetical protein [Streptomyces sp. CRN 30]
MPVVEVRMTGDPATATVRGSAVVQYLRDTVTDALHQLRVLPTRVNFKVWPPHRTGVQGRGVSGAVVRLDESTARQAALADPRGMEARRMT